ncbi:MAG: alpha/beta hydrolase [SAR324 cluster bacterium]|nr:alpha/beta hydrolase [SAR324 cluster bacterium]
MNHAVEITIEISGLKLAAKRWGIAGNPPILALHGWLDNAGTYDLLAPLLDDFEVVAVDFPGNGWSESFPEGTFFHFIDLVQLVIEIAHQLGWDQFILMGHSMGAGVATLTAGTIPERISLLILIEGLGPLTELPQAAPQLLRDSITQWQLHKTRELKPSVIALEQAVKIRQKAGNLSEQAARPLAQRGTIACENGVTWNLDRRWKVPSRLRLTQEQVLAFIDEITAPVLLLTSDTGFVPQRDAMEIRYQHVKNLTHVSLSGGHHLHLENPEVTATTIKKFLAQR